VRKSILIGFLLTLFAFPSVMAQPGPKFGAGVFAGLSIPLLQDDQSQGFEYGFKGRFGVASLIVLEPYVSFVKWGEPDPVDDVVLGIDGSKVTSFGLEASLGNSPGQMGLVPYFVAGIGSYKVKNEDTGYESSKFGFSAGLGLGVGLSPKFSLDVRGKAIVAPQEEGGSKKAIGATAGINFSFGAQ
jgi:opacity protein-like surface antigen